MYRSLLTGLLCLLAATGRTAELAIIIDDIGYNVPVGQAFIQLPHALTLAVLPFTPHGPPLARLAQKAGKEVMLHAPMSSLGAPVDHQALHGGMTAARLRQQLDAMLQDIPGAQGLNNHMGSQLTQEAVPMAWLMEHLAHHRLYFIDSRTTPLTVALETAHRYGLPAMKRDVFLDNQRDRHKIRQQLRLAIELARRQGFAIAIGHPYPETLAVLGELDGLLADSGVRLVSVSRLLAQQPSGTAEQPYPQTHHYCTAPPRLLWRIDPLLAEAQRRAQHQALLKDLFHSSKVTHFVP